MLKAEWLSNPKTHVTGMMKGITIAVKKKKSGFAVLFIV